MEWVADFGLSEPIDCARGTADRPGVRFKIGGNEKQATIEGFKITVEADGKKEAKRAAEKRANNLIDLLSATSGTFSEWAFLGMSDKHGIESDLNFGWSRRCNVFLDFSDGVFRKILDCDSHLNGRLNHLRNARRAERVGDWASVIRHLNHEKQAKNEPLRCLRNLLEHPDGIHEKTRKAVERHYPPESDGWLKFDDDGTFDPTDERNAKSIEHNANRFLDDAHQALLNELASREN